MCRLNPSPLRKHRRTSRRKDRINTLSESKLVRTELTRQLINAQETERCRIARELHDVIGNSLALLATEIKMGFVDKANREDINVQVEKIYNRTKEIAEQVRRVSHELHSSVLEYLGLGLGVQSLCREISCLHGLPISCFCQNVADQIDPEVSLCVYRVVQEALQNIIKHSRATKAEIMISGDRHGIELLISDDGIGFDVEASRFHAGLGLL